MTTLTGIVASVVVHSSAAAFSHFGLTLEAANVDSPTQATERVVARSRPAQKTVVDCPLRRAHPQLHTA